MSMTKRYAEAIGHFDEAEIPMSYGNPMAPELRTKSLQPVLSERQLDEIRGYADEFDVERLAMSLYNTEVENLSPYIAGEFLAQLRRDANAAASYTGEPAAREWDVYSAAESVRPSYEALVVASPLTVPANEARRAWFAAMDEARISSTQFHEQQARAATIEVIELRKALAFIADALAQAADAQTKPDIRASLLEVAGAVAGSAR